MGLQRVGHDWATFTILLKVYWASWVYGYMYFISFGVVLSIFLFKYVFCPNFSLFFWNSNNTTIWHCLKCPSQYALLLPNPHRLCFSLENFYYPLFRFTFILHVQSLLRPPGECFNSDTVFFHIKSVQLVLFKGSISPLILFTLYPFCLSSLTYLLLSFKSFCLLAPTSLLSAHLLILIKKQSIAYGLYPPVHLQISQFFVICWTLCLERTLGNRNK